MAQGITHSTLARLPNTLLGLPSFLSFSKRTLHTPHMGGCQNYGPFLGPYNTTAPSI